MFTPSSCGTRSSGANRENGVGAVFELGATTAKRSCGLRADGSACGRPAKECAIFSKGVCGFTEGAPASCRAESTATASLDRPFGEPGAAFDDGSESILIPSVSDSTATGSRRESGLSLKGRFEMLASASGCRAAGAEPVGRIRTVCENGRFTIHRQLGTGGLDKVRC